jgi:hypothetical protein
LYPPRSFLTYNFFIKMSKNFSFFNPLFILYNQRDCKGMSIFNYHKIFFKLILFFFKNIFMLCVIAFTSTVLKKTKNISFLKNLLIF